MFVLAAQFVLESCTSGALAIELHNAAGIRCTLVTSSVENASGLRHAFLHGASKYYFLLGRNHILNACERVVRGEEGAMYD